MMVAYLWEVCKLCFWPSLSTYPCSFSAVLPYSGNGCIKRSSMRIFWSMCWKTCCLWREKRRIHPLLFKLRDDGGIRVFRRSRRSGYTREGNIDFRIELRCMVVARVVQLLRRQVARTGQICPVQKGIMQISDQQVSS